MRTPICDQLGIEFPIFAFSHCRDVVAAVTNAGGYGVLGALAYEPERLEVELNWIDEHVKGKPYGVDFAMPAKYIGQGGGDEATPEYLKSLIPDQYREWVGKILDEAGIAPLPEDTEQRAPKAAGLNVDAEGPGQIDVCLAHPNVNMIVNALGPPPKYVLDRCHEAGLLVGALAGSKQHAERSVGMGVDVIVAQGTEAGGHCGEIATMVLIPEVVGAVGDRVPVLAAGGIATGRQMAAAMALGAQGVWTGSIWLLTQEADLAPEVVENLLAANPQDFVRSRAMTGKPARQLRSAWVQAWERDDAPAPLPMPLQGLLYGEAAARFTRVHAKPFAGSPAGQILGSVDKVRPARDVVLSMVEEYIETVEGMHRSMTADA
ncbi:MAG: nitronate monooxygenase family protein [Acidimicrobiales bacterium]|jgi:NAD(P)H-dependent flavin oxidoreductase YrpB (nitropropane dioxygenase family)|nr:nitronate monooxygenase family protein [Acidimicrobiales bacterium]